MSNRELETSKEELQSLNEALNTRNNQLALKVEELENKNSDLNNLLTSTDIAIICLDRNFCIKWFTPATTRLMELVPSDIARPLTNFSHKFAQQDLLEDAQQVLERQVPIETEAVTVDERCYLLRIIPYCADDDCIDGVILIFIDISKRKQAEEALRESEEKLRRLNQSLEQQVAARIEELTVLQEVTVAANQANSVAEAMRAALECICNANRWLMGHVYRLTDDGSGHLVSSGTWYVRDEAWQDLERLAEFHHSLAGIRFDRGEGVIGRVLETGRTQWADARNELPDRRREAAASYGLQAMVAFPVTINGEVAAVLEFFSDEPVIKEKRFMEIMPNVGIQLGHVIKRKRLEKEIAEISDREQKRLGQEMHDGLGQQISGSVLLAERLADSLRAAGLPQAEKAVKLKEAIEEAKRQCRALTKGLLPVEIDPDGLMNALEELAERTQEIYGIRCVFECRQPVTVEDSFTATHLYRIAFEAVHNAVKHARPQHIWIRLRNSAQELLVVQDDGVSMKDIAQREGDGIRIMRYRAGLIDATLRLESAEGEGTTVTCQFGG